MVIMQKEKVYELKSYKYACSLLKRKRYSERRMEDKLVLKGYEKEEILSVIETLKSVNAINDKEMIKDIVDIDNAKLYGRLRILEHIKKEALPILEADKLLDFEKEDEKFDELVNQLIIKHSKEPRLKKLEKIKQKVYAYGYTEEQIDSLNYNSLISDEDNEIISLEKDFKTAVLRLEEVNDGKLLKDKVFKSLMSKGYSYNDINILWEDYINEINK